MVVASLLLLMYPSLLYGQPTAKMRAKVTKDSAQAGSTTFPGDNTKWAEVKRAVDQGFADPAIFLRPGITIHEFAQVIQVPVYQVSKYITLSSGLGFIDAVNQRRIAYCVNKLESGEWKHFKLEAIASECGFNNRNSFTNAFKKFQGMSPSEYKRQLVSES
jgi:AraC-like DNA-binding protein